MQQPTGRGTVPGSIRVMKINSSTSSIPVIVERSNLTWFATTYLKRNTAWMEYACYHRLLLQPSTFSTCGWPHPAAADARVFNLKALTFDDVSSNHVASFWCGIPTNSVSYDGLTYAACNGFYISSIWGCSAYQINTQILVESAVKAMRTSDFVFALFSSGE